MISRTILCLLAVGLLFACASAAIAEDNQQPIQVQIKAEIYHTTRDAIKAGEKTLGVEGKSQALVPVRIKSWDLSSVRTVLKDPKVSSAMDSPILSTISGQLGTVSINTAIPVADSAQPLKHEVTLTAMPIVGRENSVQLSFIASVSGPSTKDSHSPMAVAASMNLAEGDSILCYDIDDATGKALLVIVTPTIVKS